VITLPGTGAIIKNSYEHVFLVKIKRRDMLRWELPSGIRQKGESLFLTLYRCVEIESSLQFKVRIGRPVCLVVHSSKSFDRQYFGMFFECKAESTTIKPIKDTDLRLPKELDQHIVDGQFLNWRDIPERNIHPQHRKILSQWFENPEGPLFTIASDADKELDFYQGKEVQMSSKTENSGLLINLNFENSSKSDLKTEDDYNNNQDNNNVPVGVFISYSHDDKGKGMNPDSGEDLNYLERLRKHLKPLEKKGLIKAWDDTKIETGSDWREDIEAALKSCKFALLLVSSNFLASDFIQDYELPQILASAKKNGTVIIPILLSPTKIPECIARIQLANSDSKPLDDMAFPDQERVFINVCERIEKTLVDNQDD